MSTTFRGWIEVQIGKASDEPAIADGAFEIVIDGTIVGISVNVVVIEIAILLRNGFVLATVSTVDGISRKTDQRRGVGFINSRMSRKT